MAEKTFTASEVSEMLELIEEALTKGAKVYCTVLNAVPEVQASRTTDEWLTTFVEENVKQIKEMRKVLRKG